MTTTEILLTITGREFRLIRARAGYTARELASFMKRKGTRKGSESSVYRLELQRIVEPRYAELLCEFIGDKLFMLLLEQIRHEEQQRIEEWKSRQQLNRI